MVGSVTGNPGSASEWKDAPQGDQEGTDEQDGASQHQPPKSVPIPTNDVWIAALAIQHGVPLYTRAPHFERIEGLAT